MPFLKQTTPTVDFATWSQGTRAEKIKPMARHWAEVGFGTPVALHLFYVLKILAYIVVGWAIVVSTPGIDGFFDVTAWYNEPIVFEKVVLYTMLIEVVGLGCGFGPLNNRFYPPFGSILYWLRPNTIRQPPWPGRVPLTKGDNRTPVDVVLYAAFLVMILVALFSPGTGAIPSLDTTVGAKLIFLCIWLGAATSKLNKHFPFVIATMMSNNPIFRTPAVKRKFFEDFPEDLRPGWRARWIAHFSTAVEGLVPIVLFFSHGGWVTAIAATIMLIFHFGILSSIPMGVPLEWNVFMMFGVLAIFVGHAQIGLGDLQSPWPLLLFAASAATVIVGNLNPRKVSFLPGMRYYAGNWDTTLWCLKPSASAKIERDIVAIAAMPASQIERYYSSPEAAQIMLYMGYAFRAFNSHGRALFTLVHRALADADESQYMLTDGERICSTAMGWNFGDGHLSNEQLIAALQKRCRFEPGEVRVVLLDGQPIHRQTQQYRLVDPATGEFERGFVRVADLVTRQPWDDQVPVTVTWRATHVASEQRDTGSDRP
ncbi:DUF3556 domain-containing protein [Gordonia sp. NPDC003424]